jgi:Cu2+-exporting ATPase
MVGLGKAAQHGILVRDAESLETFCKTTAIVLDKTGTVTFGKPQVTEVFWIPEYESKDAGNEIRGAIAAIESRSEHPYARALVNFFNPDAGIPLPEVTGFESATGKGVSARVGDGQYHIGSGTYITGNECVIPANLAEEENKLKHQGRSMVFLAHNRNVVAIVAVADTLKPGTDRSIGKLKAMGIQVHLLSGDTVAITSRIAAAAGIDIFRAEASPADKSDYIQRLRGQGHVVAMVGDGINDSPALALADTGIAMGTGTDIAIESARIILVKGDLEKLVTTMHLSRATVKTIRQNLFWAFFYNIIALPVAAGVLFPFTGFLLDPMMAGAAMAFSSVSVVTNSLRLRSQRID